MLMTFSEFIAYLKHLINYADYCSSHPQTWIGCAGFWAFVYLSGAFIAFLVFYSTAKNLWIDHKQIKAYKAKKAREAYVADTETMAKHIWKGE